MAQEPTAKDENPPGGDATPAEPTATGSAENPQGVANRIEELPAADGADVMQNLSTEMSAEVAEYLDPRTAAKILAEIERCFIYLAPRSI
jgi:Mg/Co/Ni transporter MgtE